MDKKSRIFKDIKTHLTNILRKTLPAVLAFSIPVLSQVCLTSCSGGVEYRQDEGMVWNTLYHITYRSDRPLGDSIRAVLDRVGGSLSVFDRGSLVSRVNEADSMRVDDDFVKVYETSRRINMMSGRMFDPTLSPLITAWGFGKGHAMTADTARIDSVMKFIGIERTRLDGGVLFKDDRRIQFNFSAIAKGYGCDAVGEMFRRNGVEDYLVEIGGEIASSGRNAKGGKWRVAIDRPEKNALPGEKSAGVIEVSDEGVATSGNYRNYHEQNGAELGHTIDPITGRPARTDVASATVVAPTAMEADGLATAIMAMGSGRALRMIEENGIRAMLILTDGSVRMSDGFVKLLAK